MRKVSILEKTKTPYRQPLFDYIGQHVDLTVYYVGKTPQHRQWNVEYDIQNYTEREISGGDIGPFTVASNLRNRLVRGNYDEIVASSGLNMLPNSYLAASAAKRTGATLTIWTEHVLTPWIRGCNRPWHMNFMKKLINPIAGYIRNRLYQCADSIVAYSRLAGQSAAAEGAEEIKITVAPQWYPPKRLASPNSDLTKSDRYRILFVGQLSKLKGVDVLLDVARNYSLSDGVDFAIAGGDGDFQDTVAKVTKRYDHISKLGYIEDRCKASEFSTADLLVLPSRHDAWGLVVNEAYIFGTPVIATNTAGAEMIVPDNLTVAPEDSEALYRAIERARRNSPSAPEQPTLKEMANPLIQPASKRTDSI